MIFLFKMITEIEKMANIAIVKNYNLLGNDIRLSQDHNQSVLHGGGLDIKTFSHWKAKRNDCCGVEEEQNDDRGG